MFNKNKSILIAVIFLLLSVSNKAQELTNTVNYTLKYTMLEEGSNIFEGKSLLQKNYFDGLGRPIQSISVAASPKGKDIVQMIEYDQFGREVKKYMPYTVEGKGAYRYKELAYGEYTEFYDPIFPRDSLFSETKLENSPLNRVMEQGSVGTAWQLGEGHTVGYEYATNEAGVITIWEVNDGSDGKMTITANGTYDEGALYVNTVTDEEGRPTVEYKNMKGQVIMTENAQGNRIWYVYDDFGLLKCVIPPMSADTPNEDYCYYYKYDERNRMVEKKIPGADWIYMVYNKKDLLILTQDGNLREKNEWLATIYDVFSRPIKTGIYFNSLSREELQDLANKSSELPTLDEPETKANVTEFPLLEEENLLSQTFYDNYEDIDAAYEFKPVYQTEEDTAVKGQITYTKTKVPETEQWLYTVNYYDDKYRVIQTIGDNHLGGKDILSNQYDFVGKVLESKQEHIVNGHTETIIKEFVYDRTGRLLETKMKVNDGELKTIAANTYNELGQLQEKSTHKNADNSYLLKTGYKYNIRGWMIEADNKNKTDESLFKLNLAYNSGTNPQYNGNISAMSWTSSKQTANNYYDFKYDNINRLEHAYFNGLETGDYSTAYNYDANGNILKLTRQGWTEGDVFTNIDDLNYKYVGNRLVGVNDADNISAQEYGFSDKGLREEVIPSDTASHEYFYDANGNMITDYNKQIEAIHYNNLNLPVLVDLGNNNKIEYIYDAAGIKLQQKVFKEGNLQKETDYVGNFIYENGSLKFIITDDGRLLPKEDASGYEYEYYIKDHLGNTRVTIAENEGNAEVMQEDHYYPFGMQLGGQSWQNPLQTVANKYLYNGKELQDDLGFDLYDYGARFYDAALGRWHSVDPAAEMYYVYSPFNYVRGNPILRIDPNGMWDTDYYNKNGKHVKHVEDGKTDKKIVLTDSKKSKDVDAAISAGAVISKPSADVMTAANNSITGTDNTGFEHGFVAATDGTTSSIINSETDADVDLRDAFNELYKNGKEASFDVHTHDDDYTMPDANGDFTATSPDPSGTPGQELKDYGARTIREQNGGTEPSWVIGTKTSFTNRTVVDRNGKSSTSTNVSQTRMVTFYNSGGKIGQMKWKNFKRTVNKIP